MCIKQKEIEKYIFRKIAANDKDVIHKTMDSFGLAENDVKKFINDALYRGIIEETDECEAGYKLIEQKYSVSVSLHKLQLSEDKMLDDYVLWSDSRMYLCGNKREMRFVQSHLLAYASRLNKIGTMICMVLENDTCRKIEEVFDMYTDIDMGFTKTHIPIKEACISGEPVARSQARRICNRLEEFKEVTLDFQNVEYIGQGFADEIFRVYATANPNILLRPINMVPVVEKMIRHVGRGALASNVLLNG